MFFMFFMSFSMLFDVFDDFGAPLEPLGGFSASGARLASSQQSICCGVPYQRDERSSEEPAVGRAETSRSHSLSLCLTLFNHLQTFDVLKSSEIL